MNDITLNPSTKITSQRLLQTTVGDAFAAFSNADYLAKWWGPEGFSNTIHEFDLRVGGHWRLTMHGPEAGHYTNESVFTRVEPPTIVAWRRLTKPLFLMELRFESVTANTCRIVFVMEFATAAECEKMRPHVQPKNEENFDRLQRLLGTSNRLI